MNRSFASFLLVTAIGLTGCSSGSTDASGPCDLFREQDAADLLDGPVEQIGFAEYLAANSTVPSEDQAKVDAAADRICMYKGEAEGAFASVQLDRGLFEDEEEFRGAFKTDVEQLDGPGLAANYRSDGSDRQATHLGVLINEEGDSIDLAVFGLKVTKQRMTKTAKSIVDRY